MAYDKVVDSAVLDAGLTSVANAIREKGGTSASLSFPQGFVNAIGNISSSGITINSGKHLDADGHWARPAEWPDLDALTLPDDFDGWYLTYDLRLTEGYGWIGIYGRTADSSVWTAERGSIVNGSFVTAETISTASGACLRETLNSANGNVQVWRITSTTGFTQIGFCTPTAV